MRLTSLILLITITIVRTVFPIYGPEVKKFALLSSIKFFIVFVLTITRDTKDTLIVTQCGAEAIAFLKVYGVIPAATAFIALYGFMSSRLSKRALYYGTCLPFFLFFVVFDLAILPNKDLIQPSAAVVEKVLGLGIGSSGSSGISGISGITSGKGARAIIGLLVSNWTSALFYIVAELYSSVSIGILFWQLANDVVPIQQAKRFYPLFGQVSSLAPVLAGVYVTQFASKAADFQGSMHRLTIAICGAGGMICFLYCKADNYNDCGTPRLAKFKTKPKPNTKPNMISSIKFLASSEYLRLLSFMVIGYGLSINFTEIIWKSLVKKKYPETLDYQRFMGTFSTVVGLTTFFVIFIGSNVIKNLGWRVGALATPMLMMVVTVPFFACVMRMAGGEMNDKLLGLAVTIGTVQSLLSKATKYALFDPTTQMAYIPLDEESKVKGKAAIDVLGSRVGKSGGSLIQQVLVVSFGSIINAAPAVATIFYSVLGLWVVSANRLSKLFYEKTNDKTKTNKKKE
ncbi:hypothetical protein ScalyP_jg4020 [Parmales sp. scaly parma]|nr:hypothetical protein ScalyP_jg4020 [Parmales sp. scaly parma]